MSLFSSWSRHELPYPDIDECKNPQTNKCEQSTTCFNTIGSYDCPCKVYGNWRNAKKSLILQSGLIREENGNPFACIGENSK